MNYQNRQTKNTENTTVYVRNLPYSINETDLKVIFSNFGQIQSVKIMKEGKENKSKGMAFVEMTNIDACETSIRELDGEVIGGRTLKVTKARPMEKNVSKKKKKKTNSKRRSFSKKKSTYDYDNIPQSQFIQ